MSQNEARYTVRSPLALLSLVCPATVLVRPDSVAPGAVISLAVTGHHGAGTILTNTFNSFDLRYA